MRRSARSWPAPERLDRAFGVWRDRIRACLRAGRAGPRGRC